MVIINAKSPCFITDQLVGIKSVKEVALKVGINRKTAYRYRAYYNIHQDIKAPQKRGPKKSIQLNNTHIRFIIDIIDRWTPTSLAATSEQVLAEFPGIKISKTPFYRFVRQHYRLSIKRLEPFVERRSSTRTIELRYNIVTAWLQDPNMDFEANCIFIDEAGFNLHTTRRQGWSPMGTQASTKLADRGQNISILGAISLRGVLGLTVRKAMRKPVGSEERRRDNGEAKTVTGGTIGTCGVHFRSYIDGLMDIVDRLEMRNHYLLMDNASIQKGELIRAESKRPAKMLLLLTATVGFAIQEAFLTGV